MAFAPNFQLKIIFFEGLAFPRKKRSGRRTKKGFRVAENNSNGCMPSLPPSAPLPKCESIHLHHDHIIMHIILLHLLFIRITKQMTHMKKMEKHKQYSWNNLHRLQAKIITVIIAKNLATTNTIIELDSLKWSVSCPLPASSPR